MTNKATADVGALIPAYKSTAEEDYARWGELLIREEYAEKVLLTMYEPMSFRIPGGRYKPDFMHLLENGRLVFVEVKGSKKPKKQRGYRDSRAKLRAAAEMYPFFSWCMVIGGEVERIR